MINLTANPAPHAGGVLRSDVPYPTPTTEAEYRKGLASMDWQHEYSGDQLGWLRSKQQLASLTQARLQLDPDGAIWNTFASSDFKIIKAVTL